MIRISLVTAIIILSTACSMQPQIVPSSGLSANSWQQHQQQIALLQDWELSGKLGFRAPDQGGSATVNWTQEKKSYQLFLSGPFGVGSAKIYGDEETAEMLYGDTVYRQPPRQLAMQLTGLPLPVDALSWWARGLPSPTQPAATGLATGADGLAVGFDQAGWQLSFSRYRQTDAGFLPGKIAGSLNSPGSAEDSSYSFKLVISNWKFLEEE
ncbi:MAG: lipoprotein insertase outer membrane protein LolB [Porticoccaceae bacterium]